MRILGAVLVVLAAASYFRDLDFQQTQLELPLRELDVGPGSTPVPALPAQPGALAGADLLLVTLDTTRPDRIGFYGNREIETPQLDRLARDGVVFTNAHATASSTLPTHASILTGRYPYHHGARVNGRFELPAGERTLAEILAEHGYATAAFVSAYVLDPRFGLDQGFQVYDAEVAGRSVSLGFGERRADVTTERALAWLRSQPTGRPLFLWVHYFDPHESHDPPEPFASQTANGYDGEIAFVDSQLGRLVEALEARSGERLLVAVTADHGEALGEHGERTHGLLLQEATLRIPLIVYAPGAIRGGSSVSAGVSQVDLVPTLLSLLGVPAPEGRDGVDLLHPPPERPILAETLEGRVHFGWAALGAIYAGSLKYVDGPAPELYDLASDPLERHDLVSDRPTDAQALRRRLHALHAPALDDPTPSAGVLSDDERARLRALGYLVAAEAEGPGSSGTDPKQMLPLLNRVLRLSAARDLGARLPAWQRALAWLAGEPLPTTTDELIESYEAVAAEHPDFVPVYVLMHELALEEGRPELAERALEGLRAAGGPAPPGS